MRENEATGFIKILRSEGPVVSSIPPNVRLEIEGLDLSCLPVVEPYSEGKSDVLYGHVESGTLGVLVPQGEVIARLGFDSDAAGWLRRHGFPKAGRYFFFSTDQVGIIFGVDEPAKAT